jgi:apolipoprotein N-acyltransferase
MAVSLQYYDLTYIAPVFILGIGLVYGTNFCSYLQLYDKLFLEF